MMCNIAGCDMPARWSVGVRVWAKGHPKSTPPADMHTTLHVCNHHKENPIHTAPEFFLPESRESINAQFARLGRALPDFDGAEWVFTEFE